MFEERKHIHRRLANPRKKKMKHSTTTNNNNGGSMAPHNNNPSCNRPRSESSSDFCMELMPVDKIVKRCLHSWSVHHSLTTNNWIATICRPVENSPQSKTRHTQFVFATEREARKFCQAYAPPKLADQPFCQGTMRKRERRCVFCLCMMYRRGTGMLKNMCVFHVLYYQKVVDNRVTFDIAATVAWIYAMAAPLDGDCEWFPKLI